MVEKFSTLAVTLLLCLSFTNAGVSYIRWGRTTCPAGNVLLYKGYISGNNNSGIGGGANYLCATQKPNFVRNTAGMQGGSAILWGSEFIVVAGMENQFLTDNLPNGILARQDMVCARCHDPNSSDVFMLPGRNDCEDSSYELKYRGFLVAEANMGTRVSHEYICLDEAPEGRPGGEGASNQAFLYGVQASCGSLPCTPYAEGNDVTCAVCAY